MSVGQISIDRVSIGQMSAGSNSNDASWLNGALV
jgi:hypothetical protein